MVICSIDSGWVCQTVGCVGLEQTDEECSEVGGGGPDCNEEPRQREELVGRRVDGQHGA